MIAACLLSVSLTTLLYQGHIVVPSEIIAGDCHDTSFTLKEARRLVKTDKLAAQIVGVVR